MVVQNMDEQNQLMLAINRYLKLNKKASLTCGKCNLVKKSALGYLSHIEVNDMFLIYKLNKILI